MRPTTIVIAGIVLCIVGTIALVVDWVLAGLADNGLRFNVQYALDESLSNYYGSSKLCLRIPSAGSLTDNADFGSRCLTDADGKPKEATKPPDASGNVTPGCGPYDRYSTVVHRGPFMGVFRRDVVFAAGDDVAALAERLHSAVGPKARITSFACDGYGVIRIERD